MDAVDRLRALPQERRIDLLHDLRARRARLDAEEAVLLAAMATDPAPYDSQMTQVLGIDRRWLEDEVACALRLAPVTAAQRLWTAAELVTRFPATLAAMAEARLPGYYAARLVEACTGLPSETCAQVETRALARAGDQTLSQFSATVHRAVAALDPRNGEQKHERARTGRRVVFSRPDTEGMTTLWAQLSADQAAHLKSKIDALARSWSGLDERTGDQRRADALCALGDPTEIGTGTGIGTAPTINVSVSMPTLLGLDDQPADLDGDPVTATVARAMATHPHARWRWLLRDDHDQLCDVIEAGYRPSAALARFIRVRDMTCRFPGCRRKATNCELDHRIPRIHDGPTAAANLQPLCKRHHDRKHQPGWRVRRHGDGTTEWTAPTGHTYRQPPPDHDLHTPPSAA